MQPDIFFIPTDTSGKLAQMPRPRAGDWLADELRQIRQLGVDRMVSMLEPSEERDLGLKREAALFEQLGGQFTRHPIRDMCLPDDADAFVALSRKLAGQIKEGGGVAIHCRAGIGRSGMMTCAVLAQLGMPVDDALKHIADYRGLRVPDTEEQADWLRENLVPVLRS